MDRDSSLLITGAAGMVGSALVQRLRQSGHRRLLTPTRSELDLRDVDAVDRYFRQNNPRYVFMIASRVGGIAANMEDPVGFLQDNLRIYTSLFQACVNHQTEKNLFLGSSCIYPRLCPQPMKEEYLMTGPLEPTNEGYALAKIAGLKMAETCYQQHGLKTVCPMPCNIYGAGDHFDLQRSHVLSALVRRFEEARNTGAKELTLWGTGSAKREFMYIDDVIEGMLFIFEHWETPEIVNLGVGRDVSIAELAEQIAAATQYEGEINWDTTRPDGMPRKCLDISNLEARGFRAQVSLEDGIRQTINDYRTTWCSGERAAA